MADRLTVVIPAYNAATTIEQAVRSAWEVGASRVIVVDDGSEDDTLARLDDVQCEIHSIANGGVARARRLGSALVETPYLVLLDADDALLRTGVTAAIERLDSDPSLSACGGSVVNIDPTGSHEAPHSTYSQTSQITSIDLLRQGVGPWPPGAAVVRAEALRDSLTISPPALEPPRAEDYEMFVRLSLVGPLGLTPQPTLHYRVHVGKSSRATLRSIQCRE